MTNIEANAINDINVVVSNEDEDFYSKDCEPLQNGLFMCDINLPDDVEEGDYNLSIDISSRQDTLPFEDNVGINDKRLRIPKIALFIVLGLIPILGYIIYLKKKNKENDE